MKVEEKMDRLLMICITGTYALGFNLAAWYDYGVYVIHPSLTGILLTGTMGFGIMVYWEKRKYANKRY